MSNIRSTIQTPPFQIHEKVPTFVLNGFLSNLLTFKDADIIEMTQQEYMSRHHR